ncbi:MAG: F0F1 ATP synthase subunit A [Acidobacteria bacterium]|nr:F0F1 ATP synthase subunit A [Acidobacteriota bacterium]
MSFLLAEADPLREVVPHPIWQVDVDLGPLTPDARLTILSDQIVMILLAGLLVSVGVPLALRHRRNRSTVIGRMVPGPLASFVEIVCLYFREEVAEPLLGEHAPRFLGFLWTSFFFVLTMNLLGLVPLRPPTEALLGRPIGGAATGNIWVTGTLAATTLALMVFNGVRFGGLRYFAHFNPGPWWLAPLMVPVEIVGTLARIFALAVRLFANMIAGHILLAVLLSMILRAGRALGPVGGFPVIAAAVAGSVAVMLLEIFVAFLQAFIFTYLSAVFLGLSIEARHGGFEAAEPHPAALKTTPRGSGDPV